MADPIVSVRRLGKRYDLHYSPPPDTLRDAVVDVIRAPIRRLARKNGAPNLHSTEIWALKDISFEVFSGEVIGIIGRNGAGKSTLLKILSRVTLPTEGWVEINGRISSLLEIGTGFHPELTGRENVYLNGAIIGMSKREIRRKFDAIVDFSEIADFIDTPTKFYSSGMLVRLGFAVAAHLESHIVVLDEVLAVGDVAFREKCEAVIRNLAKSGRTVLIVSHNSEIIRRLAGRIAYLERGRLKQMGESAAILKQYHRDAFGDAVQDPLSFPVLIESVTVDGPGVRDGIYVRVGTPVRLRIDLVAREPVADAVIFVSVARDGTMLSRDDSIGRIEPIRLAAERRRSYVIEYPGIPLAPGNFEFRIRVRQNPAIADRPLSATLVIPLVAVDPMSLTRGHIALAQTWREIRPHRDDNPQ